jgi:hypothetical protein
MFGAPGLFFDIVVVVVVVVVVVAVVFVVVVVLLFLFSLSWVISGLARSLRILASLS